jgi:radical SAM protein with 4Fe4S-binding SPASM domain
MNYSLLRHAGSVLWKRRPIQFTFFVTSRCNARCPFCFYLSRRERGRGEELGLDEIRKVSRSMGRLLWIAFSGGEVFLRDDLGKIAEIFYEHNKPSVILLPTNGLEPQRIRETAERIIRHCTKSAVAVKLSLDGPPDIHDSLRRVPGAHEKVLETCELLLPLLDKYPNFELGINSVFCSVNQDCMDGLIDFVRRTDGRLTHTVSLVRGDVADEGLKEVDRDAYQRTIARLEANMKNNPAGRYRFTGARLKAGQDIIQRRLIHETMEKKSRLVPCYAGRLTLVLTESGDLYPCESFTHRLGNVRDGGYDVLKMTESAESRRTLGAVKRSGCFCTHECYMMMNVLFNPRLYPSLLREYLRLSPACGTQTRFDANDGAGLTVHHP